MSSSSAALADSVFQGELIMSEANFLKAFPGQQGYRVLMVDGDGQLVAEWHARLARWSLVYGDALAHRRLRQVQIPGGPRETPLHINATENLDETQIHSR